MRSVVRFLLLGLLLVATGLPLSAHILNITQARVIFDSTDQFTGEVDIDLFRALGSTDAYYNLSILPHDQQEQKIRDVAAKVFGEMQFLFGTQAATPELIGWEMPQATRQVYADYYVGKMTKLYFRGTIPDGRQPFTLNTTAQETLEFPIALTVERPGRHVHVTRWLELQGEQSDPMNYDQAGGPGGTDVVDAPVDPLSGAKLTPFQRFWYVQLGALGRYLGLGFHHIVPEGTDHILFVLGLFFLGISWRKLISQTTVFTIAHATTLYLSTQNIFTLPSWLVEPGIALSIMFIALENIFKPKLNAFRLCVVFMFGLIHGLGFASGLKEIRMPPHEFIMALLGFNFGVDLGQLFVIFLAFLVVGWFRNRSWYFSRIAVPASCCIAAMGAFWAVERICFYAHIATF
jgi:hypothetical protein